MSTLEHSRDCMTSSAPAAALLTPSQLSAIKSECCVSAELRSRSTSRCCRCCCRCCRRAMQDIEAIRQPSAHALQQTMTWAAARRNDDVGVPTCSRTDKRRTRCPWMSMSAAAAAGPAPPACDQRLQHHQMHLNAIVRYAMHGCPTRRLRS